MASTPTLEIDVTQKTHRGIIPKGLQRFVDEPLAPQPNWERVSDTVVTVLAPCKHSFALNGTNTYLVGTGHSRLLIDCGDAAEEDAQSFLERLVDVMNELDVQMLSGVICTHSHSDHIGGVRKLRERFGANLPVYKWPTPSSAIVRWKQYKNNTKVAGGAPDPAIWDLKLWFEEKSGYAHIGDGDEFEVEGALLRAHHTPGHAEDHVVLWIEPDQCLFSGDHVLGWGTSWVEDLGDYMHSLGLMRSLNPVKLYPGHGPMISNGCERIEKYIEHRSAREDQVAVGLQMLTAESHSFAHTPDALVQLMYDTTSPQIVENALSNVLKVLIKLEKDGKVTAHTSSLEMTPIEVHSSPASPYDPDFRKLTWRWTDGSKL